MPSKKVSKKITRKISKKALLKFPAKNIAFTVFLTLIFGFFAISALAKTVNFGTTGETTNTLRIQTNIGTEYSDITAEDNGGLTINPNTANATTTIQSAFGTGANGTEFVITQNGTVLAGTWNAGIITASSNSLSQLNLAYDSANFTLFTTGSAGSLSIAPSGATTTIASNLLISGANRYLNFNANSGAGGYGLRDNLGVIEFKNSADLTWSELGSGGSTRKINQVAHGFNLGDVLRRATSTEAVPNIYVLARADYSGNAEAVGIVSEIIGVDDFVLTIGGYVDLAGSGYAFIDGFTYFLGTSTPNIGRLVPYDAEGENEVSKPLLVADTINSGYFINYRGVENVLGGTTLAESVAGRLAYYTSNTAVNGSSDLFISNGNLGVGSSTPNEKLVVAGNLVPDGSTRSLGTLANPWQDLYVTNASIHIGGNTLSNSSGELTWGGNSLKFGNTSLVADPSSNTLSWGGQEIISSGGLIATSSLPESGEWAIDNIFSIVSTTTRNKILTLNETNERVGIASSSPNYLLSVGNNFSVNTSGDVVANSFTDSTGQFLHLSGGTMTGNLTMGANTLNVQTINFNGTGAGDNTISLTNNLSNALSIAQLANQFLVFDTIPASRSVDVKQDLVLDANKYINFSTQGSSGYGFYDSAGILQYKNSGGAWTDLGTVNSNTKKITQANAFSIGNVVRYNGSNYVLAQADSDTNAEVAGIVSAAGNPFTLTMSGYVSGLSGLTAGETYYLSTTTAGALVSYAATGNGEISKPLLVADTINSGYFINYRGSKIGGGAISINSGSTGAIAQYMNPTTLIGSSVVTISGSNFGISSSSPQSLFSIGTGASSFSVANDGAVNINSSSKLTIPLKTNAYAPTQNGEIWLCTNC